MYIITLYWHHIFEFIFMKRQVQGQHDRIIYIVSWISSQSFCYFFFLIFISAVKRLLTNNKKVLFT